VIPPGFVQELLSRVDIVEIVGRHVQLKKAGANHLGLCPFHGEKSPSFTVSPSKQFYHCFGCGVSGDAIRFLTEHLGMSFVDAVRDLAQQTGLTVPEDERTPQERQRASEQKERQATLTDTLAKAAEHYRKQLKASPRAVDYLKNRGLTGEIAAAFGMGYAPDGWRGLASVFPHYDDPLLEESGLVIAKQDDGAARTGPAQVDPHLPGGLAEAPVAPGAQSTKRYDRFRDRIMFPIRSVQGDVIGFGGRVLDKGEPKYLNSPETPVFSKGRELYGLFEARTGMRQRGMALVVEGYMDVVALAQLGFPNAVATLGTACTAEHVQKLFRFTDSVVFSFDGDAAGRRAAGRALEASLPHASDTRSIRFLFLPPEHDPDSYVRENGAEAFERCISLAVPLSRQLIEAARESNDLSSAEGRARFLAHAKPMWFALPEGALKRQLLQELGQLGGLGATDLADLWRTTTSSARGSHQPHQAETEGDTGEPAPARRSWKPGSKTPAAPRRSSRTAPPSPADHALRMLLLHSDWWEQLDANDHDLLHSLPAPQGELFAWLERQLFEHGGIAWAVLKQSLLASEWADLSESIIPASALEDEMHFPDLRRMVDTLWIENLQAQQAQLMLRAATDPGALAEWREIEALRRSRLERMRPAPEL
jgi:DNA primase